MKRLFNFLSFIFYLVPFNLLLAFPVNAEDSRDVLQKFLQGLDSLKAGFEQTLIGENGEELESSSGVVYLQRPGRFHWDYQQPYAQKIITNGKTLWLYDEDLEQVTIRDISGSLDNTPAAILSGQAAIADHFETVDMGTIEGYEWIELKPLDPETQYSSIRLGFDGQQIGMMVLNDNLGQITRIDFIDPRSNEKLDESLFTFEPPEGVDIIDSRKEG